MEFVVVAVARAATGSVQDVHTASKPADDGTCVCRPLSSEA
ncbi:hypothetical protein ACIG5E_02050 [Kitasatospora sp. NPDC053057]